MKILLALLLTITGGLATAADSREDIEIVFDRNKGALYAEYSRALRNNPGLKGRVDVEIDIAKTGDVTACRVKSSTMGNTDLPKKLCDRISLIKFKPRASPTTITKPLDFFPAA